MTPDTSTASIATSRPSCFYWTRTIRQMKLLQPSLPRLRLIALTSEVEASAANEDLTGHVIGERRTEEEDRACCLRGRAQPPQRARRFHRFQHLGLYPDPDRMPTHFDVCFLTRKDLGQPSFDEPEADGIHVDVVATPFL